MKRWLEGTFPGGKWQSGGDYLVSSPLREDRHPSFAIHPEKRVWHDFATGEHGLLSELCKTLGIEEPGREGRAKALLVPPVDPEARQLWEKGVPATAHAYAERKGFPLDGLRVNPANGELLIPQRDPHTGEVVGVERTSAHTDKDGKTPKFQVGKRGGIFSIGKVDGEQPILISEGVSTGYSLHRLTSWPVYVAFSAPMLAAMYQTVRYLHPGREIAVAPDYDKAGHDNADKAAALGATVVQLPEGSQDKNDWLDLEQRHGIEIVKQMFRDQWQARRKVEKIVEKPKRKKFNALELYHADIRSPSWAIDQLIPEGLSVLASPPKTGKSYFVLQAALAVARGVPFLGQRTIKGRVLLLSLEDTEARLRKRLIQMVPDMRDLPKNLDMEVEFPRLDEHGLSELEAEIRDNEYRLVVIDTWGKTKPVGQSKKGENVYETDVRLVSEVKKIADKYECSILLVHHLKKGGSREGDWLESLSGSMGLSATVDGLLVIERERAADVGVLKRSGRDLEDDEDIGLKWLAPGWQYSGNAKQLMASTARKGILSSIAKAKEPVTPKYIALDLGEKDGNVRKNLFLMKQSGLVAVTSDGKYFLPQKEESFDDDDVFSGNEGNGGNGSNEGNGGNGGNGGNVTALDGNGNGDGNGPNASDTNGLGDSVTSVTAVTADHKNNAHDHTHKPGNLEKFNLPSLAEKEKARQEFFALLDEGVEVDCLTGKPYAEVEASLPCGPSQQWLESQPETVKALYSSKLARLQKFNIPDAEQLALLRTFEEVSA